MTDSGKGNPAEEEHVIREHRKWTRRIQGRMTVGRGNLVLTNRRLLFLNQITDSPEVNASVKRLADAPMRTVLDYAVTLNRNNFQVPLSRLVETKARILIGFPLPRPCLSISYMDEKKRLRWAEFRFEMPVRELLAHPQLATDRAWARAIQQAVAAAKPQ